MTETSGEIFYVAPFAPDGELLGVGSWRVADLSPRWLDVCEQLLAANGPSFRASPGQMLSHLEIKLTSARGVGLGTFYAHGRIVASTAYLRGEDAAPEPEVLRMFIESLRRVHLVEHAKASSHPFDAMMTIYQRPLSVIVAWGDPTVAEEDEELVRELGTHFAAAYLCRYKA